MKRHAPAQRRGGRLSVAAVFGMVVALGLPALPARASSPTAKGGPDLSGVTLRVGYGSVRDTSTQDIRLASGAFENTPYAIKWASFPSSTATLEALNAGAIDVTPDALATAAIVAQAGAKTPWTRTTAPFKAVAASVAPPAAGAVIAVRPGSGIRKVKDLAGKKVSYVKGGISQLYWTIAARDAKLEKGDVQTVELPVAEGRAAFLSGAVDALIGVNRTFLPLVTTGQAEVIARSNGAAPEYRLSLARTDFLKERAQAAAVEDFVRRLARSKRWVTTHEKEAAAIYERAARVDPTDAAAAVEELPTKVIPLDDALATALQEQAKIFADEGVTPSNPKVAILFDPRFGPEDESTP